MKVTPRMRRTLTVFLAGFVPYAIFWPILGHLTAFGIGFLVAAVVMGIYVALISRRKAQDGA